MQTTHHQTSPTIPHFRPAGPSCAIESVIALHCAAGQPRFGSLSTTAQPVFLICPVLSRSSICLLAILDMNSIGASLLHCAAIIFVGLCCFTLPTVTATQDASHRHGRVSASLAAQDGSVWAGQSYSAATFPVDGNNSSPVYAAVRFSPYVVSVHRRDSGADNSKNYSIPLQYELEEMVATTDRVVLRLQGSNQSLQQPCHERC